QGASMAIEDAVVLGKCLRDLPPPAAFAAFERARRERVERVVAQGKRNGSGKAPGRVGALVRDLAMPMVMRMMAKRDVMGWSPVSGWGVDRATLAPGRWIRWFA